MKIGIIYKITNKINGKAYIGLTTVSLSERWVRHKSTSLCRAISSAIKKYGHEAFNIEEIDSAENLEELKKKESFYISSLNTTSPNGYNLTSGGETNIPTAEVRNSIALKLSGRKRPKDLCVKLSIIKKGKKTRPCSELTKQKISAANTGRKFSSEHKRKLSLAKLGKKQPQELVMRRLDKLKRRPVVCMETGQVFKSASDASKWLGLNKNGLSWLIKVCKGKQKTIKGFTFKYLEETNNV